MAAPILARASTRTRVSPGWPFMRSPKQRPSFQLLLFDLQAELAGNEPQGFLVRVAVSTTLH